jgi:hypothetical protein
MFLIALLLQALPPTRLSATPSSRCRIQHGMLMQTVAFGYNRDWRPGDIPERIGLLRLTKRSTRAAGWALFEAKLIDGGRVTANVTRLKCWRTMKWNVDQLVQALNATHVIFDSDDPPHERHEFIFADGRLRYVMNVLPTKMTVFLTADPDDPAQSCPMLEYGFTCNEVELGPSAYRAGDTSVRFYEHRDTFGGLRLTLTPKGDKTWYIFASVGCDSDADGNVRIR